MRRNRVVLLGDKEFGPIAVTGEFSSLRDAVDREEPGEIDHLAEG